MHLTIDGSAHTGNYRVVCECGDVWHGQGERLSVTQWNPALPIAECVVHIKLCHSGVPLEVGFSTRFTQWMQAYWERASLRLMHEGKMPGYAAATRL